MKYKAVSITIAILFLVNSVGYADGYYRDTLRTQVGTRETKKRIIEILEKLFTKKPVRAKGTKGRIDSMDTADRNVPNQKRFASEDLKELLRLSGLPEGSDGAALLGLKAGKETDGLLVLNIKESGYFPVVKTLLDILNELKKESMLFLVAIGKVPIFI